MFKIEQKEHLEKNH